MLQRRSLKGSNLNVVDGVIFLLKTVWDKRRTFQQIAANSCEYEIKPFFENSVIVFDSYHEQETLKTMFLHILSRGLVLNCQSSW